jgi:hypothetical protein
MGPAGGETGKPRCLAEVHELRKTEVLSLSDLKKIANSPTQERLQNKNNPIPFPRGLVQINLSDNLIIVSIFNKG